MCLDVKSQNKRSTFSTALRAVFDNNWFYVACVELWGIYVHLPYPHLPVYIYLPPLFAFCYMIFLIWELLSRKRQDKFEGECGPCEPEPGKTVDRKDFMDGLARVLTSKSSYLIAALCAIPPYWLAEYYYDRYSFGIVVKGVVIVVSFAAVFAFLAYRKAKKM